MNKKIAMLPGSFDPPTIGHLDIIERCAALYDRIYVVIADNIAKKTLFTAQERKSMLQDILGKYSNIEVEIWQGLVVDFAKKFDVGVIEYIYNWSGSEEKDSKRQRNFRR